MVSYQVEVTAQARQDIRALPGNIRQRVLRLLKALVNNPFPDSSQQLDTAKLEIDLPPDMSLHRIRLESWRILYLIEADLQQLTVLAVRKRPPYQYDDLLQLFQQIVDSEDT